MMLNVCMHGCRLQRRRRSSMSCAAYAPPRSSAWPGPAACSRPKRCSELVVAGWFLPFGKTVAEQAGCLFTPEALQ